MFAGDNKIRTAKVLRVYEIKGGKGLPEPPCEGLAGIWPQQPYYYLFYDREALDAVAAWLKLNPGWCLSSSYSIPYEKWQDASGEDFRIGAFTVTAASGRGPAPDASIQIRIDPGVVFGSGLHPTTKGCLLAVSDLFAGGSEEIGSVLDLGTGTGILAIACALHGAGRTWAIDCIPFALAVARKNALANGVHDRISFICSDRIAVLNAPCDLLLMNLEWPVLEQVLGGGEVLGGNEWRSYRRVVVSGFLEGVLDRVEEMVRPWYIISGKIILEGWPTLTLVRRRS